MNYTKQQLEEMMKRNGGSLYLSGTGITKLPDNLTVGGSLNLRGTGITELPDNLTVGGYLDLSETGITVEERKKVKTFRNQALDDENAPLDDTFLTAIPDNNLNGDPVKPTFVQPDLRGDQHKFIRDTFVGTILMLRVNQSDPDENCRKLIDFLKDNPTADCDIILEKVDEIIQHE